jgi:cadmium resistance protein CadD (predicted permease)
VDYAPGIILTGAAAFAATNVDGLFLAAALLSRPATRARDVVGGTYAGIGALYGLSVVASLVALVIPPGSVRLLGLIPLALGIREFWQRDAAPRAIPARQGMAAVAAINVAFGADNIGVYTPLFAASSAPAIALYGLVFAALTGALCLAAYRLVTHPALGAPLRRYGPPLVPWVLIALGVWILLGF